MDPRDASAKIKPPRLKPAAATSDAATRFLASMTITYEMWHDGNGYDLETLAAIPAAELPAIANLLITHSPRDWRDIEALGQIDLLQARAAVIAALKHSDPAVRREAQTYAPEHIDPQDREARLIRSLESAAPYAGLTQALDEAEEFHPPAVIDALFKGALSASGEAAVHYAALLFFLHGKAKEAFDWEQRPFFLRFNESDRKLRRAAFEELCDRVGVAGSKYLGGSAE
jgi:hypothetical protein